jgi:hypothetical protein
MSVANPKFVDDLRILFRAADFVEDTSIERGNIVAGVGALTLALSAWSWKLFAASRSR